MSDIHSALNDGQKTAIRWLAKKRWCHLSKTAIIEKTKLSETEVDQLIAYLVRRGGGEAALTNDRATFENVYVLPEIQTLVRELNPPSPQPLWLTGLQWSVIVLAVVASLCAIVWLIWQP